ncbi:aminotransferase class IV [Hyphococcus flavus]|uniref:Probable branched-chain-amino-acid aminotransferase n=1 Tax=Hyphococcus flavus TaxID=1866326 RepID=A0AAE9ZDQ4_9PROT|nr:aminotransferase class IV [Hyphococcus flavus]WDI33188.1 aminotransferase class IV [Hyphococcus flavus]
MAYWLNGAVHRDQEKFHIADRGFLLGDGLFETLRVIKGKPIFLKQHLERLRASALALKLSVPYDDIEILSAIASLVSYNNFDDKEASIRITLTRGVGRRGLALPVTPAPLLLITCSELKPQNSAYARLMVSRYRRSEHSVTSHHKTLNYLDNVMAKAEAAEKNADEAIMLNSEGRIACAAAANIFSISNEGTLLTPALGEGALRGVTRAVLLRCTRQLGIDVIETKLSVSDLNGCDIFLTNSLIGILPGRLDASPEKTIRQDVMSGLKSCYEAEVNRELCGE